MRVCVLGAGVIGLTTALQVRELLPNAEITVIADKFGAETTSHGAAGLYRPSIAFSSGANLTHLRRWLRDGWKYYSELATGEDGPLAGAFVVEMYNCYTTPPSFDETFAGEFVFECRDLPPKECGWLAQRDRFAKVFHYKTVNVECRYFLPWLQHKLEKTGVTFVKSHVARLDALYGEYDVVMNCGGFGNATALAHDSALYPVRGVLIRVHAPWLKSGVMKDQLVHFYPLRDCVVVGGLRQRGRHDTDVLDEDRDVIWKRAIELEPSLKHAKVLEEWSGLRPHREGYVRVEAERVSVGGRKVIVVHNYGHGASGITLGYGTSAHAVRLLASNILDLAKL